MVYKKRLIDHHIWRRHPDLNRGIKVLQTFALPLGYSADCLRSFCKLTFKAF